MSRNYNDHSKDYNLPQRVAKKWSNKVRRCHGKRLVVELEKAEDVDEVEIPTDIHKDSGDGDIWNYE